MTLAKCLRTHFLFKKKLTQVGSQVRNVSNVGRKVSLLPLDPLFHNLGSGLSSLPALRDPDCGPFGQLQKRRQAPAAGTPRAAASLEYAGGGCDATRPAPARSQSSSGGHPDSPETSRTRPRDACGGEARSLQPLPSQKWPRETLP